MRRRWLPYGYAAVVAAAMGYFLWDVPAKTPIA
jgi:hypothetical protein